MNLKEKYTDLLINIGFSKEDIQQHWVDFEFNYSNQSRFYHNLKHLQEMVSCYDNYFDRLQFPNEVLYSIFYHDYIYVSSQKDNELKSAEYAIKILPKTTSINSSLVFDMICATQKHQHNQMEDINWLIDFDLKILAKDWEDYKIYFAQIRQEYGQYPEVIYKEGRAKALKHFLEYEFIFQTEVFRKQFEQKARANIEREILLLQRMPLCR